MYLQQAIKKGSAKNAIEGLSHTADNYNEAVSYLKMRYDHPRLIYRTHVQKIVDAPSLKDSGGKELCRLYDTILQHVRALKSMDGDLTGAFLTSIIELKLDSHLSTIWSSESSHFPSFENEDMQPNWRVKQAQCLVMSIEILYI